VPWHFFTFRKLDSSEQLTPVLHEPDTSHHESGGPRIATH
jgi:hypothetical protein